MRTSTWRRLIKLLSGSIVLLMVVYLIVWNSVGSLPMVSDIRTDVWRRLQTGFRGQESWWTSLDLPQDIPRESGRVRNDTLNVFVVEEHHEALAYWFGAANLGLLPKKGNTLIHIDGHSDLAPPTYIPGYPLFTWPKANQVRYLLQRNDAFIQSSGMAGLLTRVIWVWPDWDRVNHDQEYGLYTISLGWTTKEGGSELSKKFCVCEKNETQTECKVEGFEGGEYVEYDIPRENCHIRKTIVVEEVEENKAVQFFQKGDWIAPGENVILDIDEDFYGCTYAITPLLQAGVSNHNILFVDDSFERLFCPKTTVQEGLADEAIGEALYILIHFKTCVDDAKKNINECLKIEKDAYKVFQRLQNTGILCPKTSDSVSTYIRRLVNALLKLSIPQIRVLKQVGFCLANTPKTLPLTADFSFGICHGANTPNDTAVTVHTPSYQEVMERSILLKRLLTNITKFSPRIVTLCRSVRDGYTPREFFDQIEKDILTNINSTLSKNVHVRYDEDLMGGKLGWPKRHI